MAIKVPSGPSSQLWLLQGDCSHRWSTLAKRIADHPFNHAVEEKSPWERASCNGMSLSSKQSLNACGFLQIDSPRRLEVLLPHSATVPDYIEPLFSAHQLYYTAHLPLSHMIQPDIISKYIALGSISALSVGTRIDIDNVYSLLPTGKLILSLDKDTYEQLGLQGRPSRYTKNQRFVVELDLTAPHFKPGKPNYERVKWCLTGRLDLEAEFVICWNGNDVDDESTFLEDFKATRQNCLLDKEILASFPMATIRGDHPHGLVEDGELLSCTVQEFHTWLGVVANGGLATFYEGSAVDSYVSRFLPPEPHSECQHGIRTRWTGMVSPAFIVHLLEKLRDYLSAVDGSGPPWVAVTVWGFEDTPVSWRTNEHGYCQSGDNHYTVVLFRTGRFWYLNMLGSHDVI